MRLAWLALCAVVGCAVLGVSPTSGDTRVWWAHVPLDSLRPVQGSRQEGERAFAVYRPLRPSAHVAWHRLVADESETDRGAPAPGVRNPERVDSGRVVWSPAERLLSAWVPGPETSEWVEVRGDSFVVDSVICLRNLAERGPGRPAALRQVARLALADGDSLAADSMLASPALARSVWAWPALRQRAEVSLARGDTSRADSLLEAADRGGWPDAERAAWLAMRVRLRTDLRDTARAIGFARQALRVYPSTASAGRALSLLEALLFARGDSLTADEQRAAAEVEVYGGRRAAAIERLRGVASDAGAGAERWRAGLRLCELLRGARRFAESRAAAGSLLAGRVPEEWTARLWIEKARAELGAGRPDSALAIYSRLAADDSSAAALCWEAGRVAEDAGRWDESLRWYGRVPPAARRGPQAGFRAGVLQLALGRPDSALACWAPDSSDGALFWCGVARRFLGDTAAGDSLLRRVAEQPGYSFYRAAARDTLGMRGWPGGVAPGACISDSLCAPLREAEELLRLGLTGEAVDLLLRWVAGDARLCRGAGEPTVTEWLGAARLAYEAGRIGLGISLAERAREAGADLELRLLWDVVPWAFPPAYEPLFVSPQDSVVASLEPALLFALTRQESVFDPRARSRSDALGLMQLKLPTAADMARLAHDAAPAETTLFDPERNVRYGARYLRRLLGRFDGSVAAALEAYNAGAGSLSPRWRELRARGGEALVCELAANPLAQDYAKRILGYRQGYRELRPTAAGP